MREAKGEERHSPKSRPEGRLSRHLSAYFRAYVRGDQIEDDHVPVFRALKAKLDPDQVLYPGCHRHITPSFFFAHVHYVDVDARVGSLYSDPKALSYVNKHKAYPQPPVIRFSCRDFHSKLVRRESVDLLLSLSAGIVSKPCMAYLRPGGYLLVNDAHSDARLAYLDPRLELAGVYDETKQRFLDDSATLKQHFHLKDGSAITLEMVEAGMKSARTKRQLGLKALSMFYLFRKKRKRGSSDRAPSKRPSKSQRGVAQVKPA